MLTLNNHNENISITSPDSSIIVDDISTANTIKLSSNTTHVLTPNGKRGMVNPTSDETLSIDSSQPNVMELIAVGSGGGGSGSDYFRLSQLCSKKGLKYWYIFEFSSKGKIYLILYGEKNLRLRFLKKRLGNSVGKFTQEKLKVVKM
jgi:hypothetical protein